MKQITPPQYTCVVGDDILMLQHDNFSRNGTAWLIDAPHGLHAYIASE